MTLRKSFVPFLSQVLFRTLASKFANVWTMRPFHQKNIHFTVIITKCQHLFDQIERLYVFIVERHQKFTMVFDGFVLFPIYERPSLC